MEERRNGTIDMCRIIAAIFVIVIDPHPLR